MGLMGNTLLAGKQPRLSPEEEKYLFDAGISYLSNGAPEAAYYCLDRIIAPDLPQLFNKALCCYLSGWYEECHRLLDKAGQSLSNGLSRQESLPPSLAHHAYSDRLHLCPMPRGIPQELARTQLLRLKAETAFRLQLYGEVKAIAASLQKPYQHIEKLIKQISYYTEGN